VDRIVICPSLTDPLHLDADDRVLYRSSGEVIPLPAKSLDVLVVLVERAGQVVSRETLRQRVWDDAFVEEANITKNISLLRSTLREHLDGTDAIKTLSKRGYQFTAPVALESALLVAESLPLLPTETADALPLYSTPSHSKIWLTLTALVVIAIAVGAVMEHLRSRPAPRMEANIRPSVAVLELKNLSAESSNDWLGTALEESLGADLARSNGVRLVSPERTAQVEQDMKIGQRSAYDTQTVQALGRSLNCDLALVGFYLPLGDQFRIDLQLRNTGTGAVVGSFTQTTSKEQLLHTIAEAGSSLRHDLNLPPLTAVQSSGLPEQDGLRDYAEGLRLIRTGHPAEAQPLLSKAVLASPESPLAHSALAAVWTALGFEERAAVEARFALDHSAGLPNEQRLDLQAKAFRILHDWPDAIKTYTTLRKQYPDNYDYTLGLSAALEGSGKPGPALELLRDLVAHSKAAANDLRVLHAETNQASTLADWRSLLIYTGQEQHLAREEHSEYYESDAVTFEGSAWSELGDNTHAAADYHEAERMCSEAGDEIGLGWVLNMDAWLQIQNADPSAGDTLQRALKIATQTGNRALVMQVLDGLANNSFYQQDFAGARKYNLQELDIAQQTHTVNRAADAELNLSVIAGVFGQLQQQMDYARQALTITVQMNDPDSTSAALRHIADAEMKFGDINAARSDFQKSLDAAKSVSEALQIVDTLQQLANLEMMAGNLELAQHLVDQAAALHIDSKPELNDLLLTTAELRIEEGHPEAADGIITPLATGYSTIDPAAESYRLLAESALLRGDLPLARADINKALALDRKSPDTIDNLIPGSLLAARIDAASGSPAKAYAELPALLRSSQKIKDMPLELEIRLYQGEFEAQMGRKAQAASTLHAVEAEATQHGFGLFAKKAQEALTAGQSI
jgi:DNA-binding winged helix-turn-helix (wHTH) protein/tetratricopeptide (TPR) repeat protein